GNDLVLVEVFHFTGALVYSKPYTLKSGKLSETLMLGDFAKGIYFVKVESEGDTWSMKVVLE
ncbi:MAG: T9SS type A sorting domain-containing protein, partial [Flavobacteriales bacterium]|nr:T9SS type A sorting domain-containing protein [Flavobacteriales bacterium]